MKKNRIAIIDGFRTPMGKMGASFKNVPADILGSSITSEIYNKYQDYDAPEIEEVIIGNVSQPAHAANIARVIALRSSIPQSVPAFTVHRNCASGMEAITTGVNKILAGEREIILAGGVESMSNIPFLYSKNMQNFFEKLAYSKTIPKKLKALLQFRLKYLAPVIGLKCGLTDPVCDMIMGDTAELLAKDFNISREEQDRFAMQSHNKAEKAQKNGVFAEELIATPNEKGKILEFDEGIRAKQNMKDLAKLKPFFDRKNGTVTAGNSSQLTDGAAACILMSEEKAKSLGITPLGYIADFNYAGCEPQRMGLGPVYAMNNILQKRNLSLNDIDLFEINEAFAAQAIACVKAMDSKEFCVDKLNLKDKIGLIEQNKLNVNGGAIALGHPVGMTGARIIFSALRELKRQNKQTALVSLCIGGGQGGATLLERE